MVLDGQLEFCLRPFVPADRTARLAWGGDPEIERYLEETKDPEELAHGALMLAVEVSGAVVGEVLLTDVRHGLGTAELRICIGQPNLLGLGLGRRILQLVLEHASQQLHLKNIYLRVYAENRRAVRCYLAAGFLKVGYVRRKNNAAEGAQRVLLMERQLAARPRRALSQAASCR